GVIVGYTNVGMNLGTTFPPSNIGAYTYSNGVFSLPISAANNTYTTGINNLGQVASYGADPFIGSAILAWVGSLATPLSTHFSDPAATAGTFAEDVNNAGIAVGYYLTANSTAHAFWEINGSFNEFRDIPNNNTIIDIFAFGINDAGQTVGYYIDNVGQFHG